MVKLDQILNLLLPQPEVFDYDPSFDHEQVITRVHRHIKSAAKLIVIVPSWHANRKVQQLLFDQAVRTGSSVIAYEMDDRMLSPNPDALVQSFAAIGKQIAADVRASGATDVHFSAASLGCAMLLYAMGEHNLCGTVDLVVPGGNCASGLWHGIRTQELRAAYEKQGLDETKLQKLWIRLSPTFQAPHIHNSSFRIYYSHSDLLIRPDTLPPLFDALKAAGNMLAIHPSKHLGHYGSILTYALRRRLAKP